MLAAIRDHIAIGRIGQCWNCPAEWTKRCDSTRYLDYRPSYAELAALYRTEPPARRLKRRYDQPGFDPWFEREPWPLPECRVNEWAAMIDLEVARPVTMPIGEALAFGVFSCSGSDTLDIGVAWFRGVSLQGHRVAHMAVDAYVRHAMGPPALFDKKLYFDGEQRARETLLAEDAWRDA